MGHGQINIEPLDRTFKNTQAFHCEGLFAGFKEGLHAQADAKERPSAVEKCFQGFYIAFLVQDLHHVPESPDPGEDQPLRVGNLFTTAGDFNGFAQAFDGVYDAADIAGAVIK